MNPDFEVKQQTLCDSVKIQLQYCDFRVNGTKQSPVLLFIYQVVYPLKGLNSKYTHLSRYHYTAAYMPQVICEYPMRSQPICPTSLSLAAFNCSQMNRLASVNLDRQVCL